ncbi:peptidyl-prolyl cis-trans isomerase [Trypanosoma rangeli]|uniref:Peptidyl-prolyl cis-trans isomerase n=1 Tax=Trypanosoma rangeli TaxID=5698 RepID=A0A3R7K0E7_TRYRA|nr:peptidyl-prolyl cis-trans isomerase [Trypanosoma rangeli]RNE99701.1 peptidyl-prolyl cis-trans isomerase [Trypanosoma rangeli]|eukprot:RNE99701.1 peptidyl-prolyl cis-trans isomerase [Trypanosoma rangeli]
MMSISYTNSLFARVTSIEKAAEVAKKAAPKVVQLSEEAKTLPPHIRNVTEPAKLNAQTPFFKCPPWAGLPAVACHLQCTRDGVPLASLGLERFPFYLFGRSRVCDYVLEHPSISSIHAVIVFHSEQQCFVLVDLGSTNGVKLNGLRIEKRRPIPTPIGSCIQFGCSSRMYKVARGPPPSSKRLREEQEEKAVAKLIQGNDSGHVALVKGSNVGNVASSSTPTIEEDKREGAASTVRLETHKLEMNMAEKGQGAVDAAIPLLSPSTPPLQAVAVEALRDQPNSVTAPEPLPHVSPASPVKRHLYQVLIKHKDVRRPVSLAPRNKGDKITRSKPDALALAEAIIAHHGDRKVVWSLDEFTTVVRDYSECGSAKRNGDLGMVESGTYTDTFDLAAFALDCGMVSAPVETELGVHLIYRAA